MSNNMLAIAMRTGARQPELLELPKPQITSNEVLVRGVAVGVCGTDLHIIRSARPNPPAGADYLVLGHEGVGRIEAVGANVRGWDPGAWVVACVRRPRHPLPYRADLATFSEVVERGISGAQGFAQQWWVDEPQYLFHVPEPLGILAVLTETFTVSEKAINESVGIQTARLTEAAFHYRQPRVLVTGLGPIAFAAAIIARARGFSVTIAGRRDPTDPQVQLATDLELDYLDTRTTDFGEFGGPERAFDMVLEASGSEDLLLRLIPVLAARGILCVLGSERNQEPTQVHLSMLLRQLIVKNQVVFGVVNAAAPRDFHLAFADMLWVEHTYPGCLERMITHRYPIHSALQAYAARPHDSIKRIVLLA